MLILRGLRALGLVVGLTALATTAAPQPGGRGPGHQTGRQQGRQGERGQRGQGRAGSP